MRQQVMKHMLKFKTPKQNYENNKNGPKKKMISVSVDKSILDFDETEPQLHPTPEPLDEPIDERKAKAKTKTVRGP